MYMLKVKVQKNPNLSINTDTYFTCKYLVGLAGRRWNIKTYGQI